MRGGEKCLVCGAVKRFCGGGLPKPDDEVGIDGAGTGAGVGDTLLALPPESAVDVACDANMLTKVVKPTLKSSWPKFCFSDSEDTF